MTLKTRRQIQTNLKNTLGTGNPMRYLTIHQTDNFDRGASAAAHANLQSNGYVDSWHWTVDDKEAVQSYEETVKCAHAGDGSRGTGNNESIAVEFCVNSDGDYNKAFDNAAQLAAQILARRGIPISRMVQHNYWSGKNCPSQIRKNGEWAAFRDRVQTYLDGKAPAAPTSPSQETGKIDEDGYWGTSTTRALQRIFGTPVDGEVSSQASVWKAANPGLTFGWKWTTLPAGSQLIIAMQKKLGVTADGLIGPATINALSARYGIKGNSKFDGPSLTIRAMQRSLNKGKF